MPIHVERARRRTGYESSVIVIYIFYYIQQLQGNGYSMSIRNLVYDLCANIASRIGVLKVKSQISNYKSDLRTNALIN